MASFTFSFSAGPFSFLYMGSILHPYVRIHSILVGTYVSVLVNLQEEKIESSQQPVVITSQVGRK